MTALPSDLIIRANRFAIPQFIAIRTSLDTVLGLLVKLSKKRRLLNFVRCALTGK
jgi:hypothetical protein